MFINQLKLVLRRLKKSPFYTTINVLGLTLGLTTVLFITIYVEDERSFDRFHTDADQIYRLTSSHERLGKSGMPFIDFADYFAPDIPEIEAYSRVIPRGRELMVSAGETDINLEKVMMTDANFFEFFSFELIDGVASEVFNQTDQAVISQSVSKRLFGDENPIGQELVIEKGERYIVSGVSADPPGNSTIQFNVLLYKRDHYKNQFVERHSVRSAITWVKLNDEADVSKVLEGIAESREKPPYSRWALNSEFDLLPLTKERLEADFGRDLFEHNDKAYVQLFTGIGIAVLLLALINYVNMVTAQSIKKVKEVGLRKVIGARKSQLMLYHLVESSLLTLVSFLLAFGLVERLMPMFNQVLEKNIEVELFSTGWLGFGILLSIILGLISGLYPAFYINKVKPLALMSRFATSSKAGKGFKKGLVLFQFVATAVLILVLVIMRQQMNYLEDKDLGFDTDLVMSVPLARDSTQLYQTLKNQVNSIQGVNEASLAGFGIGGHAIVNVLYGPRIEGQKGPGGGGHAAIYADEHLLSTLNIQMIWQSAAWEGVQLKKDEMLVNASMAEKMDWMDDPVDRHLYINNGETKLKVVGIVPDLFIKSLKTEVEPMVVFPMGEWGTNCLLVKLEVGAGAATLDQVAETYSTLFDRPFSYELLETQVARFYAKEQGQFMLFQVFSTLALFISLLGLLALTTYTLQQRRKEISIRKILGATLRGLVLMLNKEYVVLVVIAFALASPIAYYFMDQWLADFAYRISVGPMLFIATLLGFLLLCWLLTASQSLRVSHENPADVLRDE